MRTAFQTLLILTILCLPWAIYAAQPPARAKAGPPVSPPAIDASVRAAIALASAQRGRAASPRPQPKPAPVTADNCGCCPDCRCKAGTCDCAEGGRCAIDCTCGKKDGELTLSWNRAVLENKPLVIWNRQVCPPCERKLPDCVHCHLTECELVSGKRIEDCCVIVARPGQGRMDVRGVIQGLPDDVVEQVWGLLNPAPRVMFVPPPPPPMFFGGFGCASGG